MVSESQCGAGCTTPTSHEAYASILFQSLPMRAASSNAHWFTVGFAQPRIPIRSGLPGPAIARDRARAPRSAKLPEPTPRK